MALATMIFFLSIIAGVFIGQLINRRFFDDKEYSMSEFWE